MLNAHTKGARRRESAYRDHPIEGQTINNALHRMWGLSGKLIGPEPQKWETIPFNFGQALVKACNMLRALASNLLLNKGQNWLYPSI